MDVNAKLAASLVAVAIVMVSCLAWAPASAHGGGCRKSSPPGKCCHMDNSEGRVHCH